MSRSASRPADTLRTLLRSVRLDDPAAVFALFGAAVLAVGAVAAPGRVWPALLVGGLFVLGLGLAGLVYVAIHYTAGAGWDVVLRRGAESLAGLVPVGSALSVLAVVAGGRHLYPSLDPGHDLHAGPFKELWLEPAFFYGRAFLYGAVWTGFALVLRRLSRLQDAGDPGGRIRRRATRWSAALLPVFAATLTAASFDWVMALSPHWYSTIFGVYQFSSLFAAGLAALILLAIVERRRGRLRLGGREVLDGAHLHDLGKLLFAMSTFWAYIWFSQYMLIWYGNLAEEAAYFVPRTTGAWAPLFWATPLLMWVIPFLVLLPERAKRSERVLIRMAVMILAGRLLDLYVAVHATVFPAAPVLGGWEAAILLGTLGAGALVLRRHVAAAPALATGDPHLPESLAHHG